jgi:hypothetical protein
MKKVGIIIFIIAVIVGISLANLFSVGEKSANFFSFSFNFGKGIKGSGNIMSETRNAANFNKIDVGGVFEVEIVAQKDFSVQVEADDNLLPYIVTEVDGNTLEIKTRKSISSKNPLRVRISAPNIENLDISGASKISLANLKNESLNIDSSGASKINIDGETKNLIIDMSGASRLDAENLRAENVSVEASGASNASVFVSGDLKADLSGTSQVNYVGNPQNLQKKTSGASFVNGK